MARVEEKRKTRQLWRNQSLKRKNYSRGKKPRGASSYRIRPYIAPKAKKCLINLTFEIDPALSSSGDKLVYSLVHGGSHFKSLIWLQCMKFPARIKKFPANNFLKKFSGNKALLNIFLHWHCIPLSLAFS